MTEDRAKTKSQGPTAVLRWAAGLARAKLGFKTQHQASKRQLTKEPQISIRQAPAAPQPTKPSPFQTNQRGAYSPASHPKSTEQRRCFKLLRAPYRDAVGGKRWGSLYRSSQGHLLFLLLGLQHRREGDLKSCPGMAGKKDLRALRLRDLRPPGPGKILTRTWCRWG